MKNVTLYIIIALVFAYSALQSQPKREFRAAWVATVSNIDWPSNKSLSATSQKAEIISILDKHKANNINAILLQIRPSCDAFYLFAKEPLSEYLVGTQGGNLSSTYDPLQFWIDEARKRNMELHCWFNPYRSVVATGSSVHSTHISKTQPSWNITYGASPYKLLDPGLPMARDYVISVIMDVVRRYNIDGVHFDDYFYPYGGMTTQDSASWSAYGSGNIGDWRRNNVNTMIHRVHDSIKTVKPWVKFGVSPFGIWKPGVPSGITGLDAYNVIYCDPINWLQNKKVDYITPQLYWIIGGGQDYSKLMPWWASQTSGRHLYTGNAAYRLGSSDGNWPVTEIQNQLNLNRDPNRAQGIVFFSSKSITNNLKGVQDSLRANQFKYFAIPPAMPWLDSVPPIKPGNLVATSAMPAGVRLQWQKPAKAKDNDSARYFVIYRAQFPDTINMNNVKYIRYVTANDTTGFVDASVVLGAKYSYAVTTMDKLHNESDAATITLTVTSVQEFAQAPEQFRLEQNFPNPFNPNTTIRFTLPRANFTSVKIYDLLGREVVTIVDTVLDAGRHSFEFNGANLASGVYIYRLIYGDYGEMKKMILQK